MSAFNYIEVHISTQLEIMKENLHQLGNQWRKRVHSGCQCYCEKVPNTKNQNESNLRIWESVEQIFNAEFT